MAVIFDGAYEAIANDIDKTSVERVIVASPADSLPVHLKVAYGLKTRKPKLDGKVFLDWKTFVKDGEGIPAKAAEKDCHDMAIISHTGGTTGEPKGVMCSDYNINALICQIVCNFEYQRQETCLSVLPPFVNYSLVESMMAMLFIGFTVVLLPKYEPLKLGEYITKYKPYVIFSIPAYWEALLKIENIGTIDVERQRGLLKEHPEEKDEWRNLRTSIIKQNKITVFMTLPYFFLRILFDSAGLILKKKDFDDDNRIYRQLMAKYIDMQRYRESFEGVDGKRKYCFDIEEQIMEIDEIADCTVTKLEKKDRNGRKYIGVFIILNKNVSMKVVLDKISNGVPVFVDSKKWVEVIKPMATFYNDMGMRDFRCLKCEVSGFYDRVGQAINIE